MERSSIISVIMKVGISGKKFWSSVIPGYSFTRVELFTVLICLSLTAIFARANLHQFQHNSFDSLALVAYDDLKNSLYLEMSSPRPNRKYLVKNILGPGPLPPPMASVLLPKNVRLNYLIRVSQPAKNGRGRALLRFELWHEKGTVMYRYTEVEGEVLEQVIKKTVIDG